MIFSMTGYAAVQGQVEGGTLHLELRAVNHRYLEIQLRLPDELRGAETELRERLAARLRRGKVECRVGFTPSPASDPASHLNHALLDRLAALENAVRKVFTGSRPLTVSEILGWPGIIGAEALEPDRLRDACLGLLETALGEFTGARGREGAKLKVVLLERLSGMEALLEKVAPKLPAIIAAYREKLASRLREVLAADDERVRQEVAVFAARVDVDEELTRLRTHIKETRRVLDAGGAAGKRLDFLMQELNREANTLGSKSADAELSQTAMDLKLLVEQMREQIQNIE